MTAWIGVDLDGTLAHYDTWIGPDVIGAPVAPMVARIKTWLAAGTHVKIVTARVAPGNVGASIARPAIETWCLQHIGTVLPVTHEKDMYMLELWDDRAVQVVKNTGIRADGAGCTDCADGAAAVHQLLLQRRMPNCTLYLIWHYLAAGQLDLAMREIVADGDKLGFDMRTAVYNIVSECIVRRHAVEEVRSDE